MINLPFHANDKVVLAAKKYTELCAAVLEQSKAAHDEFWDVVYAEHSDIDKDIRLTALISQFPTAEVVIKASKNE